MPSTWKGDRRCMSPLASELLAPDTLDIDTLCSARDKLWHDGWALLPGFLSPRALAALNSEADRLLSEAEEESARTYAMDRAGGVLVMNGLDARSEMLFDFARTGAFVEVAEYLLGKAVIPIHAEYFGKPARGAIPTPPHQDQVFYQDHFTDERAITFWCPLQDVAEGGGALAYLTPAAPYGVLLAHRESAAVDFGAELTDASGLQFVPVAVPAGSCLVHHAYTVHRSGPMLVDRSRRVFAFNFRGSSYREHLRHRGSGS